PAASPNRSVFVHKPRGYVSTRRDPAGRPVVVDLLPPESGRLYPVGRLDFDAEGLLLLTNDGGLADRLLHPRYEVLRVYEAEVEGRVAKTHLPRWRRGVTLPDGRAVPKAAAFLRHGPNATWRR